MLTIKFEQNVPRGTFFCYTKPLFQTVFVYIFYLLKNAFMKPFKSPSRTPSAFPTS